MDDIKIFKFSNESLGDAISGLSQLKPILQNRVLSANLDGQGKEDCKEIGEHFDTAVNAMTTLLIHMEDKDDIIKFYYCESEDEYWIGKRVDTLYYAKWTSNSFTYFASRNLPWGIGNYPSEPKEIDFTKWINGFLKKINS
jgi:hypothetical protein